MRAGSINHCRIWERNQKMTFWKSRSRPKMILIRLNSIWSIKSKWKRRKSANLRKLWIKPGLKKIDWKNKTQCFNMTPSPEWIEIQTGHCKRWNRKSLSLRSFLSSSLKSWRMTSHIWRDSARTVKIRSDRRQNSWRSLKHNTKRWRNSMRRWVHRNRA